MNITNDEVQGATHALRVALGDRLDGLAPEVVANAARQVLAGARFDDRVTWVCAGCGKANWMRGELVLHGRVSCVQCAQTLMEHDDRLDLVGSAAAAAILGVAGPHVSRLRSAGRLRPIPVEGTHDVYRRGEVKALAREIKARRRRKGA